MTSLFTAVTSNGRTENGAVTNTHTDNFCLDLFFKIGASRGKDLTKEFLLAKGENEKLATQILFWARDVREGAGERQQFRSLVKHITTPENAKQVTIKIIELGWFDGLLVFLDTEFEDDAVEAFTRSIANGNALAAKWLPRKGRMFNLVRKAFGCDPKTLRKRIVELSNTVEQKMCAKQWNDIDFSKVPSLASSRYMTAFHRNAEEKYVAYKNSLVKGESKINASAVYPYDITKAVRYGDATVADAQWKALPNYMENFDGRMLPVIDVSGSMRAQVASNVSALEVAVGLGLYISERATSVFKDTFITFSERPQILKYNDGMKLADKIKATYDAGWGYNTNLVATFDMILQAGLQHNVPESEMPTHLVILSDMEFDEADRSYERNHDSIKRKYQEAGYKIPQIIYWNLNAKGSNFPVRMSESGACLVSGFSPSLLKFVMSGDVDPIKMMLNTVNKDRYTLF